ncbi:MAG: CPBP family intramembrane metalloprotease [Clostridiales bacterium]|nr:CPBP family intramembrane metalloprotease [Clostridiales bacterium]
MLPLWLKRDYKAVGYALASCVGGLILMRLIVYFAALPSATYGQSLGGSALFSLCSQLIFFLAVPFCIYKFYGKRTVKQTLEYSSVGKFKPYFLLAIPLGLSVYFMTVGVSSVWTALLKLTGYTVAKSADNMPDSFVFGFFVVDVLLTAILPAVCEEFAMRGGLLSTAKNSFSRWGCIVLCGIVFGLFHQNIRQVFYTALFGALAAYLTLNTKSLYPAMLMHFTNNFLSVFVDYADNYKWAFGGGFYAIIGSMPVWALMLVFLAVAAFGTAMVLLMLYIRDRQIIKKKREALKDCAFDATNKRVVMLGEFDAEKVKDLEMEREVYGKDYAETKYKPTLRDLAMFIALGVVTLLTTVFTYVWGFLY